MGLFSFKFSWWAPKGARVLKQCVIALQGHPRSLILAPFESAYATSCWSSIVTLVLSCPVSEILQVFCWEGKCFRSGLRVCVCVCVFLCKLSRHVVTDHDWCLHTSSYPAPGRYRERGIVFARFLSLFVYLFICFFVNKVTRKRLDRFAWNFQGKCGVTMGRPDSILGQFR